ncbi:MAG: glutathione S-transferase family protein [Pseudomonadota bacterium]
MTLKLYGKLGWGSAIIEAQLAWYGLDYAFINVGDLFEDEDARKELSKINPVAQIPTLVMDDGSVMTESAAITLRFADLYPQQSLVPSATDPSRSAFLRWLMFIIATIYPTYTYGDDPSRFVSLEDAQEPFGEAVLEYGKRMYLILESASKAPWFLGEDFSAIDIYIGVLHHWEPNAPWFRKETPKLSAIADRVPTQPTIAACWMKNFPTEDEQL